MRFTIPAAVVLGALFLLPSAWCATLADGLIGYWPFDGNGTDASTLGNDLTIYGGAGFADGLLGQALDLHGDVSKYAARPVDDAIYDFGSSDFTVQAWVNYYNTAGQQTLIEKFKDEQGPGWTVAKLEGALHFSSMQTIVTYSSWQDIGIGVWHQITMVRRADVFQIYYEGEVATHSWGDNISSDPVPDTIKPLLIGRRDGTQQFPTDGRIDEVAIWNRALNDAEIAYLYNGGSGNPVLPPPEPILRRVPADYPTIQEAIDASLDGDTVLVAPGEYVITEPITFRGKAITVRGEGDGEVTTIRMSDTPANLNRASIFRFENAETAASIVDGFTIRKAKASGVYCVASSPTIINCIITGNSAAWEGGGVYCESASPTLTNCTIARNSDGGVLCWASSPTLVNCVISGNGSTTAGGMYCASNSAPVLTNCLITGNWGRNVGGIGCNLSSPTVVNCTIVDNSGGMAGALCVWSGYQALANCIVWGNTGGSLWFEPWPDAEPLHASYSCIESDAIWPGEGNINVDPFFVGLGYSEPCGIATGEECVPCQWDPATYEPTAWHRWIAGDYRLRAAAPCIDAGTLENAPAADIEGNVRPCGAAVDMGAYEYCPSAQLALSSAHVAECTPAHVFVSLTNSYPVQAFSLGVAHDPAVATLTAIDLADCPVMQALNGGQGPDYFGVDLSPGTGNCAAEIAAGGTIYCIASETQPSTVTIPAGTDQPISRLTYEAVPGNAAGTESALAIVGCLGGDVPREVIVTIAGISYTPNVLGGILTVDAAACRFIRGDGNRDGRIDISDVVTVLMYMFENGRGPLRCEDAGDANDDGALDIADAVRILGRLFAHGGPFNPPYPDCGADPTLDGLRCGMSACE